MKREIRLNYGVTVPRSHGEPEFRFAPPERRFEDTMKGWTVLTVVVAVALVVALVRLYLVWQTGVAS